MTLTFIMGTRPEVIKLAPVILHAKSQGRRVRLLHTGQHLELTEPLLRFFRLRESVDEFVNLEAMLEKPSLTGLSARVLERLDVAMKGKMSDWIIVQGDTTSAFVGAYWAFCHGVPVAHVEAGLRTGDLRSPFPEEANRVLIGRLANAHFAPTAPSMRHLLNEGTAQEKVFLTGNTSIDALHYTLQRISEGSIEEADLLPREISNFIAGRQAVLVTAHRRENLGEPLQKICLALRSICDAEPNVRLVLPVHPNPNVRSQIRGELEQHPQVMLCEPLSYIPFIQLMSQSKVLITDSGGVQEEGPSLRKPIIVIRETTERPEGVDAGFAELVGSCPKKIFSSTMAALSNGCRSEKENPYGDGRSSARIIAALSARPSAVQTAPLPIDLSTRTRPRSSSGIAALNL